MSKKSLKSLAALAKHDFIKPQDETVLQPVAAQFAVSITPHMANLLNKQNPNDPIHKQFIPNLAELTVTPEERADPTGDNVHTTVRGIVHRYPDRCLLTPVFVCPVYCRFCFRKEKLGPGSDALTPAELEQAYAYIEQQPAIWEVILTGGDPLIMKPASLQPIIARLNAIAHVEIIRIHTRVPVVDPARINIDMLTALKSKKPIYIVLHANHTQEFSPAAIAACASIIDAGIPMLSQSTLLKDINDDIDSLSALMRCFIKNRIKPYYLHHADLVPGTQHFRTSLEQGQLLMKQLRGRFSGLCQPTYVLDIPGGYGKVPVGPRYLHQTNCLNQQPEYEVEDYLGKQHCYP